MSYIAADPSSYKGKVVGNGQCVAFVKAASGAPATSLWKAGKNVLEAGDGELEVGIAIATFDANGHYPNSSSGNHAAILVARSDKTLTIWDQWSGQPVDMRNISDKPDSSNWSNDSSRYSIIESSRALVLPVEEDFVFENCCRLDLRQPSEYGKKELQVATPSWSARLSPLDDQGTSINTELDSDLFPPLKGLGKFQGLRISFAYPLGTAGMDIEPVGEVSLTFICGVGPKLNYEVLDTDGQLVAAQTQLFTSGKKSKIKISYPGIGQILIPRWQETVLDSICARVLPLVIQ